eukprot:7142200-Prymnesium_polylepis.1
MPRSAIPHPRHQKTDIVVGFHAARIDACFGNSGRTDCARGHRYRRWVGTRGRHGSGVTES